MTTRINDSNCSKLWYGEKWRFLSIELLDHIKQGLSANTFKFWLLKNTALFSIFQLLLDLKFAKFFPVFFVAVFHGNSRMGHWDRFTASLPRRWIELACLHWQEYGSYPGLSCKVTPGSNRAVEGVNVEGFKKAVFGKFFSEIKRGVFDQISQTSRFRFDISLVWPFLFSSC